MTRNNEKKIGLIVDCLANGGAEKIASRLSLAFDKLGYEVSIISLRDQITYDYAGKLYNLGINDPKIKPLKQLKKIINFRKAYKTVDADYYIDFRMRNRLVLEALLHFFVFRMDRMLMRINNYNIHYHLPKNKRIYKFYENAKALISLTDDITVKLNELHEFKNIIKIPNFFSETVVELSEEEFTQNSNNYIIAVGRLTNRVKQFDKLLLTYKQTDFYKANIPLFILGQGPDKAALQNIINTNGLNEKVKLLGFKQNPYKYIKNSKFLVLTSIEEGFPNVVLEALACGTPVISFNCKSGPSDLIINNENGLLVEDQNFNALKESMNLFYNNDPLYERCKNNAKDSVKIFREDRILKHWTEIFNN